MVQQVQFQLQFAASDSCFALQINVYFFLFLFISYKYVSSKSTRKTCQYLNFWHFCIYAFLYFYHLSYDDVGKYFCVHMFKWLCKHKHTCMLSHVHTCRHQNAHSYIYIYICELRTCIIKFTHTHSCEENFNFQAT